MDEVATYFMPCCCPSKHSLKAFYAPSKQVFSLQNTAVFCTSNNGYTTYCIFYTEKGKPEAKKTVLESIVTIQYLPLHYLLSLILSLNWLTVAVWWLTNLYSLTVYMYIVISSPNLRKDHFSNHSPLLTNVKNGEIICYYIGWISTGTHRLWYFYPLPHLLSPSLWLSLCFSVIDIK